MALEALRQNPAIETVVLVAAARAFFHLQGDSSIDDLPASPFYPDAFAGLSRYTAELVAAGKRVVLVVDNPTLPDPKRCMANARVSLDGPIGSHLARFFAIGQPDPRCQIDLERHRALSAPYRRLLLEVAQTAPGRISIFETAPYLCDLAAGRCGAFDGDMLLYSFSDHVSDYASTKIGRALNDYLAGSSPMGDRSPKAF